MCYTVRCRRNLWNNYKTTIHQCIHHIYQKQICRYIVVPFAVFPRALSSTGFGRSNMTSFFRFLVGLSPQNFRLFLKSIHWHWYIVSRKLQTKAPYAQVAPSGFYMISSWWTFLWGNKVLWNVSCVILPAHSCPQTFYSITHRNVCLNIYLSLHIYRQRK